MIRTRRIFSDAFLLGKLCFEVLCLWAKCFCSNSLIFLYRRMNVTSELDRLHVISYFNSFKNYLKFLKFAIYCVHHAIIGLWKLGLKILWFIWIVFWLQCIVQKGTKNKFRSHIVSFARHAETCRHLRNVHFNHSCSLVTSETQWFRSSWVRVILQICAYFFHTRTKQKVCV